jgi:copper chaperone
VRKATIFILAALALMAFAVSPIFACDKDAKTSASTGTTNAQMVGEKTGCTAHGTMTAAECAAKCANMSPAECAAKCGSMSEADLAKMCNYDGKVQMVNMSVKGMTCGGCESSVKASLEKVPGVVKVCAVSYKDNMAVVVIDPTKTKTDALTTAVSNKGYAVEVIPAVATTTTGTAGKSCSASQKAACAAAGKAGCAGHGEAKTEETKATTTSDNQPH